MKTEYVPIAAALLSAALACGCSRQPGSPTGTVDDRAMAQAVSVAVAHFGEFRDRFRNPQPGDTDFSVKVRIVEGRFHEDLWIKNPKLDEEPFSGIISNEPTGVKNVKKGQNHSFLRKDVVDWMYRSNGKVQGNQTMHVILKSLPPDEADALRKQAGW